MTVTLLAVIHSTPTKKGLLSQAFFGSRIWFLFFGFQCFCLTGKILDKSASD